MTVNNITGNKYSDEWYTDQETVSKCIELLELPASATILCPFDSEKSLFVRTLKRLEYKVIYGINDYLTTDYIYDYAITNPPFSIKDMVIKRAYESGKKTLLILPLDSVGGVKRHLLFNEYGFPHIYIPTRRIKYYDENWDKRNGSNFHSVFMIFNHKETPKVIWESTIQVIEKAICIER